MNGSDDDRPKSGEPKVKESETREDESKRKTTATKSLSQSKSRPLKRRSDKQSEEKNSESNVDTKGKNIGSERKSKNNIPVQQTKASAGRLRNNQPTQESNTKNGQDSSKQNSRISTASTTSSENNSKKLANGTSVKNSDEGKTEESKGLASKAKQQRPGSRASPKPMKGTNSSKKAPLTQSSQKKLTGELSTRATEAEFKKMSLEIKDGSLTKENRPLQMNRQISQQDKLITFKETLNPRSDFDQLERHLSDTLNEKEKSCLKDLKQYLVKKEDAWLLDHQLLNFIGGLLGHRSLNPDIRVRVLRLLAAGALRDDFWSFLQMDRKEHHLMAYCNDFEDLTVEEQKAVAIFLCNNFSTSKGAEWLLYGSPWSIETLKKEVSNAQITSKVAAYSLVSYTPSLQDYGSGLIYNIALKEAKALQVPLAKYTPEDLPTVNLNYGSVSDTDMMTSTLGSSETKFVTLKVYNDITVELCMAVLKFLKKTKNPDEDILYRCIKSLLKFSLILKQDLLSCVAMVQVDLDEIIPGKSVKVDELWKQLRSQLMNNSSSVALT